MPGPRSHRVPTQPSRLQPGSCRQEPARERESLLYDRRCRQPTPRIRTFADGSLEQEAQSRRGDGALSKQLARHASVHALFGPSSSAMSRLSIARSSVILPPMESFAACTVIEAAASRPTPSLPLHQKLPSWSAIKSQTTGSVRLSASSRIATRPESGPGRLDSHGDRR